MSVYPPSEDTFLLARYVESLDLSGKRFLEMGCGSGYVSVIAARRGADVTAVDINPEAVEATLRRARNEGVHVNAFVSDLFANVDGEYDVIVFNPPYLPVEGEDPAWSGGKDGRAIVNRFLTGVDEHLAPCGRVAVVQSSLNAPGKTVNALLSLGYTVHVPLRERFFFEELMIIEGVKPCP